MAGNIMKWWKHKILGGYKQFSVQECTTDSEELMYNHQVRASSSCSAPPDLLLVNDREYNIPLHTGTGEAVGGATTPSSLGVNGDLAGSNNNEHLHRTHPQLRQHQQNHNHKQQQQQIRVSSLINSSKDNNSKQQKLAVGNKQYLENDSNPEIQQNNVSSRHVHHQQRSEDHIRLEEFTCDVSVEGGKSSQPLQFSFTFYDLDGHHGKITKDDIVGIVYTIYESIGKSVVVPHSGSKTINVRLTVSPDGKSKASKVKKTQNTVSHKEGVSTTTARRLHRYRPRKLIKSDEEDEDSNSEKEREVVITGSSTNENKLLRNSKLNNIKLDQECCQQPQQCTDSNINESMYQFIKKNPTLESCRECETAAEETRNVIISPTRNIGSGLQTQFLNKTPLNEAYVKNIASTRIKMLRKSRKQKNQDATIETRQRSLSVGSEACWNNRHLQKIKQQQARCNTDQYLNGTDVLDGIQMRNALPYENAQMSQNRNSAQCWKSALNRNDLISIIRESMEKNRLCFQLNGKPQANVSPIRHNMEQQHNLQDKPTYRHLAQPQRHRSNTVSKIPMLIANHSYRSHSFPNNNDVSPNDLLHNNSNSNNIFQVHPQLPTNDSNTIMNSYGLTPPNSSQTGNNSTRTSAGHHSKVNLCGYDSFLHATICGGGLNTSPPSQTATQSKLATTVNSNSAMHQQIATVQPILSSLCHNPAATSKNAALSITPNQFRTNKIMRNGSYSLPNQTALTCTQNSPQHLGYQRLCSNNKQINFERSNFAISERDPKDQAKKYDQMLYAKLTEKLQQTNLATTNRDNVHRRRNRVVRHRRSSSSFDDSNKVCVPSSTFSKISEYSSLIPIGGDPLECENLLVPTSDDECHSQNDVDVNDIQTVDTSSARQVAEGTLVDLDDKHRNIDTAANGILNLGSDNIDFHIDDELVVDEAVVENLADREDISLNKSGRSSSASKDENDDNVANTSITSSLIHRYVHEHIHHHYHHFEDKDE